jgi:hypothetical protein
MTSFHSRAFPWSVGPNMVLDLRLARPIPALLTLNVGRMGGSFPGQIGALLPYKVQDVNLHDPGE